MPFESASFSAPYDSISAPYDSMTLPCYIFREFDFPTKHEISQNHFGDRIDRGWRGTFGRLRRRR
jgi:hypothetical protein